MLLTLKDSKSFLKITNQSTMFLNQQSWLFTNSINPFFCLACSAGVFFERAICSRKRHVKTSQREEELPSPLSFFRSRTYRKGYYFYSPQSSTNIKSKMAAAAILRTRTRFRPPEIRLHCRLFFVGQK